MRIILLGIIFLLFITIIGCGGIQAGGPLPMITWDEPDDDILHWLTKPWPEAGETTPVKDLAHTADNYKTDNTPMLIRVLINASGFSSHIHVNVAVTATGPFTVRGSDTAGIGTTQPYEGGEIFTVRSVSDLMGYAKLYIKPDNPNDRIEIVGLARNWPGGANPLYRGFIEIAPVEGGFIVINELPLEEYLYAVVPGEMPSSYGLEASKVQAVAARSFAYRQLNEKRFQAFDAHIDDSVFSQVYNNLPENEIAVEAVKATNGLVLANEGQVIIANYFSTSGGTTANAGEVWAGQGVFPGHTPTYLRAGAQYEPGYNPGDLSREDNAAAFFRDADIPGFERDFPWFRWQARMTAAEITASINSNLTRRRQANPALITSVGPGGEAIAHGVASIGRLLDIEVTRRGQGGNIMEMLLVGTDAVVRVQTEFNIRSLLAPRSVVITLHNGNTLNGWAMMPSAFFTMEKEKDADGRLIAVTFFGGGHGHGVGMSQNGAKALLDRGYTYRETLRHFYPGTELVDIGSILPVD